MQNVTKNLFQKKSSMLANELQFGATLLAYYENWTTGNPILPIIAKR